MAEALELRSDAIHPPKERVWTTRRYRLNLTASWSSGDPNAGDSGQPTAARGLVQRVVMSPVKAVSLSQLRRRTGWVVRGARKHGAILVLDRGRPVATLVPTSEKPSVNPFATWKPLKRFAVALDRPVGGSLVEDIIRRQRDR